MLTLTRFGMTTVATAAVVILLFGCTTPPATDSHHANARPAGRHGELLFLLNDSDQVRIPGHWNGDTLSLHNAQETLVLLPQGRDSWSIPVFDGTLSLVGDTGSWKDVLRPGDYRVPVRWEEGVNSTRMPPGPRTPCPGCSLSGRTTLGSDSCSFNETEKPVEAASPLRPVISGSFTATCAEMERSSCRRLMAHTCSGSADP